MKATPKDVFLHILITILLYASASSFLVIIFQFANLTFPDPLEGYYAGNGAKDAIRFALSTLIVVFPLYLGISRWLEKMYAANPETRSFRIRKWLIYFTLFAAALLIVGDLISIINNLLQGEFTARFFIKAPAVLFVAGSVFGYYLWNIRKYKIE